MSIEEILEKKFGFNSFRPLQRKSIEAITSKQDLLTILPTGGGKSLCYQLPALYFKNQLTVVISPLIALINDQVMALKENGIKADKLTSELNKKEISRVYKELHNKELSLLYVSPERANMYSFKLLLQQLDISFIVIDEAHCVSEWGHEFRPDYRKLHFLKEEFSHIPVVAFTATATSKVADDIVNSLRLNNPVRLKGSFFRDNLILNVKKRVNNGRVELINFLKNYKEESGIIYTFTRKETQEIANFLNSKGFDALAYHAGLKSELRRETQDKFIKDKTKIIVATIAFGMGIDKSNVRFVVHMDLPKSMESYYQEIGRAGRDGLKSECLLLYSINDVVKKSELMNTIEDKQYKNFAKNKIEELYAYANSRECRHKAVTGYFEESLNQCENLCDNCQKEDVEELDITKEARMLLSTIYRTGQNFGKAHIIDILRGSKNEKVLNNRHDKLSVYAIGVKITKTSWNLIIDKLFEIKALKRGGFRELVLTLFGADILKGNTKVGAEEDIFQKQDRHVSLVKKDVGFEHVDKYFEAFKQLRKEIASKAKVPPYVVFSDKTLKEIASRLPQDKESFLKINGVAQVKLERYGEQFIQKAKELI
ncbi:MAG: DNA helicase RecQ [Sulfurospirillum sp.]|nr:DNA helicase RecQ [Sulfurospirillum sp.]